MRTSFTIGSRLLGAALQALLLVLLARTTSLGGFGAFGVTSAIGAIALGILSLGLPTASLRLAKRPGYLRTALRLALFLSLLVLATSFLLTLIIVREPIWAIVAGAAFMAAESANNVIQSLAFGREELSRANLIMVLRRAVPLAMFAAAAVTTSNEGLLFASLAAGSVVSVALCACVLRRDRSAPPLTAMSLIREAKVYWHTNIWSMAQQLDVVIIGGLMGATSAAVFTAAFRLASPVHIVTSLIVSRLIPVATATPIGSPVVRKLSIGAGVYAGALLALSPLLAVLAIWVLGPDYVGFWAVFALLFANSAVSVINQTIAAYLFAADRRTKWVPRATALSTISGLLIVLISAISAQLVWAAAGTLFIQVLLAALLCSLLLRPPRTAIE